MLPRKGKERANLLVKPLRYLDQLRLLWESVRPNLKLRVSVRSNKFVRDALGF